MRSPFAAGCWQFVDDNIRHQLVPVGRLKVGEKFAIPPGQIKYPGYSHLFDEEVSGVVVKEPERPAPGALSESLIVKLDDPERYEFLLSGEGYEADEARLHINILVKELAK